MTETQIKINRIADLAKKRGITINAFPDRPERIDMDPVYRCVRERGNTVEILAAKDVPADEQIMVICIPAAEAANFPDNRLGMCRYCRAPITCRPTVPLEAILVCLDCGFGMMGAQ